jgi:hypothetical protein
MKFTWQRFEAEWIGNAHEAFQQHGMFFMIPIAENDSEFFIVLVCLVRGEQKEGSTKAVDILTLNEVSAARERLENAPTLAWA